MDEVNLLTGHKVKRQPIWVKEFLRENWQDKLSRGLFVVRIFMICAFGTVSVANAITGMVLPSASVDCIWDGFHEATAPINQFFRENDLYRNALLIFSSFLIDLLILNFAFYYILWGKSWRPVICLGSFYTFRALI
jgi:hypothetical protein